jgi:hypothetical protein
MIRKMKSPNIRSTTGREPVIAAPTAMPMKPGSAIGVSTTRVRSEFLDKAGKNLEGRSGLGHVLADDEHGLVAAHFFGEGLVDGLGKGDFTHGFSPQAA